MGLTLEAFGETFGRTKANVHAWEKGLHEPAYALLLEISRASGIPLPGSTEAGDEADVLGNAFVVADLLRNAPKEDRHVWVTVIRHGLHEHANVYSAEQLSRYETALKQLDAPGSNDPAGSH